MMIKKYYKFIEKQVHETFRDITSLGSFLFLVILVIFLFFIDHRTSLIILTGAVAIEVIGSVIKILFFKSRPNMQRFSNILEKIDSGSFPSIHSARVVFVALSVYSFFSSILALLLLVLIVIFVGISRIVLNKHYFIDVFAGYVFGFLIWFLVRMLF